jgi:hypothetical protein
MRTCTASVLAVLVGTVMSSTAVAQQPHPFVGEWEGTMKTQKADELEVKVVLTASGGTWRFYGKGMPSRKNPCVGRDFPIEVKSSTDKRIVFKVSGASVLKGCVDDVATLNATDDKALQGALADGRKISLTRR